MRKQELKVVQNQGFQVMLIVALFKKTDLSQRLRR